MLSSVLRSDRAIRVNVEIMRAFVRLRRWIVTHKDLVKRIDRLEARYDDRFSVVFESIRDLMRPPARVKRSIGFGASHAAVDGGQPRRKSSLAPRGPGASLASRR